MTLLKQELDQVASEVPATFCHPCEDKNKKAPSFIPFKLFGILLEVLGLGDTRCIPRRFEGGRQLNFHPCMKSW